MAAPISSEEFAATMQRFFPFEKNPMIAIGVSGGADSMALLHLTAEWAKGQGGCAIAIAVDHNIRVESTAEATQVGTWAAQLNVEHIIMKWDAPDSASAGLQQRARAARHALLEGAAAARGILHLAIAHHEDDQAETVLLRLSKGSGPDGLAGMTAIVHKSQIRLLRPLLGFVKERLQATCIARGQEWIDDPSNQSTKFARPRLRAVSDALAAEGMSAHHLALTAAACGRTRATLERMTARYLGECARILPQGFAELTLCNEDTEITRRALAELVQTIGGGEYPANAGALDAILQNTTGTTLGSCVIKRLENKLLIIRENRNIEPPQQLEPNQPIRWERFAVEAEMACEIGALEGDLPKDAVTNLPRTILATQPAFRVEGQVIAIPTIGYHADPALVKACKAWFSPKLAAGKADFAIV